MLADGCKFRNLQALIKTLSAPTSHSLKSQAGILCHGFCLDHCNKSMSLATMYGCPITCKVESAGSSSHGNPSGLSWTFLVFGG